MAINSFKQLSLDISGRSPVQEVYDRYPKCLCPPEWAEQVGFCIEGNCPAYDSCGGWTWDPPCGGCDNCLAAQFCYYSEWDSYDFFRRHWAWRAAQVMNA